MIKVLFICLGNICRSPMAEAYFKQLVKQAALTEKISVDSAATSSWNIGKEPHEGTQKKLLEHNISSEGMTARQIEVNDFKQFDYIVAMDDQNIKDLSNIQSETTDINVAKLMDFVTTKTIDNIPDPYYTGDFEQTYQLVEAGCQALLEKIKTEHQL